MRGKTQESAKKTKRKMDHRRRRTTYFGGRTRILGKLEFLLVPPSFVNKAYQLKTDRCKMRQDFEPTFGHVLNLGDFQGFH
jgi:hypothetical protein